MPDELLDPIAIDPLDISGMVTPPPAQNAPQAPQTPKKKGIMAQAALAALMPFVAKRGGQPAVAALIQSFHQARMQRQQQTDQQAQQDFQNQRLTQADQRAQATASENEEYRAATLAQHQRDQAAAIVKDFSTKLAAAETPEEIDGLSQAFRYAAQVTGIRPDAVEAIITKAAPTPSAVVEKQVRKVVGGLTPEQVDQYLQGGAALTIPGQQLPVPVDVWSKYVVTGVGADGKRIVAVKTPPQPANVGSFEDYVIRAYGENPTPQQIEQARKAYMQADDKPTPTTADGLSARQMQQVQAQARTFEGLPVVKNTQKMSEAVSFANSMDPNTKNPADDQALIYAFAKAMDPDSVVREGEYATVQKYAQSWLQSFGFNAARVLTNTEFLTPQARQNMKRTIQQKFKAAQAQYKAVRDSYVKKINKISGLTDGEDWLTDYGAAFPSDPTTQPPATGRATVTAPSGPPARSGGAGPVANPFRR
jgi:hypothetical protein